MSTNEAKEEVTENVDMTKTEDDEADMADGNTKTSGPIFEVCHNP